jgi:CheY-like chemotaxis protein
MKRGIIRGFLREELWARAAGCDYYVTKPYSPVQLLRNELRFVLARDFEFAAPLGDFVEQARVL